MENVTEKLNDVLRRQVEDLLHKSGIRQLNSYGWLNENDADPEFVGHAMWQVDQPLDDLLEVSVLGRSRRSATAPVPPEWQRLVALEGADFSGLMQAARMSIGLFLVQAKFLRAPPFDEDDLLDLHWLSSVLYLSTASDRIRSLFIAAVFRKSADSYENGSHNGNKRTWYTTPFIEARKTLPNPSSDLAEALAKAPTLATKIHCQLRTKRNELIHERATAIGRRQLALLDRRSESAKPRNLDFASLQKAIKESEARHKQKLDETTKQLADWHELLVRTSNEVFIVEHYRRSQPT